jgi:hypothetical protein
MAKFKVGDRVRLLCDNTFEQWGKKGEKGTVIEVCDEDTDCRVDFEDSGRWYAQWSDLEHVSVAAVAGATADVSEPAHKFKVGDIVNNDYNDLTVAKLITRYDRPAVEYTDGGWDFESGIKLVSRAEPTPTPIAETLGIDLNPPAPPQVGDSALIIGTIAGITHSPRGTNYNIVFETQNRRMSLHFLEEDFIVVDDEGDSDCPCANDNGPLPYGGDTAKAFDAMGDWLRGLAVERAA